MGNWRYTPYKLVEVKATTFTSNMFGLVAPT